MTSILRLVRWCSRMGVKRSVTCTRAAHWTPIPQPKVPNAHSLAEDFQRYDNMMLGACRLLLCPYSLTSHNTPLHQSRARVLHSRSVTRCRPWAHGAAPDRCL